MRFRIDKQIKNIKWKYLISEILLIVIAINVGLWFNNLNDLRKEKKLETKILGEFIISLKSDREDIISNIETHAKGIESCERLLTLNQELIRASDFASAMSWSFLIADLSSYESLKSIGIQLIKNDKIRRDLTKLYNVDYKQIIEFENNHKRICYEFESKIGDFISFPGNEYLISESNIIQLKQLTYLINKLKFSHENMKSLYENQILMNIENLLLEIKKEVN